MAATQSEFDIGLRKMVEILVTVTWLALNLGLNFFNKWAFTPADDNFEGAGFTFPIFFTMWNMVASFLGANVLMLFAPATRTISCRQFGEYKISLLVLSLVFVTNVMTNNASLVYLGLSINQVMKCCVPLPAIIFSYILEKKTYPWEMVFAVFVIAFGAALCVPFGSSSVTSYGMLLVIISTTMSGLRPVMSALLMASARDSGLSPIPLLWYDSLISVFTLLIVFLISEERTLVPAYFAAQPGLATAIVLTGSSTAFLYNVVTFYLIKLTSALNSTILGNVKTVLLILAAAIFFDQISSAVNWIGYIVFFGALFVYSYLNYQRKTGGNWALATAAAPSGADNTHKS
jgi:hypothetical protein